MRKSVKCTVVRLCRTLVHSENELVKNKYNMCENNNMCTLSKSKKYKAECEMWACVCMCGL
jgi:hypothetical protein